MADTRNVPNVPRRDDAFLVDDERVCPLADNTRECVCWWVTIGRPTGGVVCACMPPVELWGRGR